jgi:hypothetical protein
MEATAIKENMETDSKSKKPRWDGKSRVSTDLYRKRWNEIFNRKGSVINTEKSFISREYPSENEKKD